MGRDSRPTGEIVAERLGQMDKVNVQDAATARLALSHALAAVAAINHGATVPALGVDAIGSPEAGLLDTLQAWLERLLAKLTEIVAKLAKDTTFSLSVGTGLSVTLNFPPLGEGSVA